ncbi:MAG TPA: extradiol ring-cleavage dioxygenase [Gammaproteobacteria bacterium]|uniref:Extradiol ring-cleavage dioxygenase n=1 Tax=OM182 bacterium TaxID=2510334 RepID=A0A520S1V9_9GAMM|nr:extradiol ring-cleavage dioxygenase [Gammaproteobacteria bacterium]RZO76457.1 MAG: extradiol ring-cleavage dioxygenase [OM182 bacterium]HAO87844.1 extradiol ring-cleavage dioxygenase [Gammaproteobacteria bacterium]HAR91409.1 extradiol ring-cleavage dioxygenase [Gammaproteobacteria bacterium]HAU23746.1 extradiol ring-cleavage dioxygenase [Gammaproteobacteria bacterium]
MSRGKIVGAAIVSHHPGLFQAEEFRIQAGDGRDSDLVAGFKRVRDRIEASGADTIVLFDTHWFTTGCHLVDAGAHYEGTYISDEMPWYLHGQQYGYDGDPELARLCATVAEERQVIARAIDEPTMARHYGTINIVNAMIRGQRVMSVGSCQTAATENYLEMGEVVGEAIKRSDRQVVLLASGALSHKFRNINTIPPNPCIYHPDNVSSDFNRESDYRVIELLQQGNHQQILENFDSEYRRLPWEAWGAHYLQMVGAMGGANCTAKGLALSEYENAHGTGNIHMWFDS